jgi:hypothetical protein
VGRSSRSLVGAAFTALIQSSSATVGIVVVLASQGLVDLRIAIAIALGAKIGTCVTAAIAAIGQGAAAKRTAAFHVLLNLGGALLWLPLIGVLADLVTAISPSAPDLTGTARLAAEVPRQLANAYTLFTAVNLVLVIGFTRPIARGLEWLIPEQEADPFARAHHLDAAALSTPSVALKLSRKELGRLGRRAVAMVRAGGDAAVHGTLAELEAVKDADVEVDELRGAIVTYLADLGRAEMSDEQADEAARQLAEADDLEAIGDVVETGLVRLGHRLHDERIVMSESTAVVIGELLEEISRNLEEAVVAVGEADRKGVTALLDRAPDVKARREAAMSRQAVRLADQGPGRAGAYAREVELISEIYRIHTLTKRLLRRQLTASIELGGEPEEAEAAAAPPTSGRAIRSRRRAIRSRRRAIRSRRRAAGPVSSRRAAGPVSSRRAAGPAGGGSGGHLGPPDDVLRSEADEQLAGDAVASSVVVGVAGRYVALGDPRRPRAQPRQVVTQVEELAASFDHHEGEREGRVVHDQTRPVVAAQIASLHARLPGREHERVTVQCEPDRRGMGTTVGADGREHTGTCPIGEECPALVVGHLAHGSPRRRGRRIRG